MEVARRKKLGLIILNIHNKTLKLCVYKIQKSGIPNLLHFCLKINFGDIIYSESSASAVPVLLFLFIFI